MPQSFASLHIHIVFSTKRREPWIDAELRPRLFEIMGGILGAEDCSLIAAGGTDDHVHVLVSLSRTIAVADVVRVVKSNSSNWIHGTIPDSHDFKWQTGYGAFAVSYSGLGAVKAYLANQETHHAKMSFQDEYRELLTRHGITWDERYVWD
jgi:REP element-mobilizing transposase RayT